jgi:DNA primase
MEIQDIKTNLSIESVLAHYQIPVKNNHCKCPFHEDDKPSLRIYPETNTYHCFGCGKTGDVIQFIQDYEKLSKHEALKKAASLTKLPPAPSLSVKSPLGVSHVGEDLEGVFIKLKQNLHRSKKAIAYLQDRGLSDLFLEQGYNYRSFPKMRECIVYPLKNSEGNIVSLYGRSIASTGKHYYLENRKGLYPNYPSREARQLIITESIIDAATILKYTDHKVLAMFGTNGFTQEHTEVVSQLPNLQEIILFLDGDKAGRQANKTISKKLNELLPQITISVVDTPDDEDVNSLIISHEPEILNHLIEKRTTLFSTEVESLDTQKTNTSQLDTTNPEYIIYKSGSLEISVLGGIPMHNLDKLKVTLRVNRKENPSPLFTLRQSNVDLYNDDVVTKLIRKLAERLELGTKEVQHVFYNLIGELENYRLHQIEVNAPEVVKKRILSATQKQAAIAFLKAPNLLQRTNELIGKTGLVGEENNRLLMYLVFTSRLREQPLHIISLGASGTGKTYLQEKISELIPEDQKLEITALSENALYYFDRTELKNKLVLIEDLDGAQDDKILYAIRELMSKKRISKTLPIKDAKGNLKTITLQVEGPITLAGTTTKEKIYEDNANRSILIYLDNSKKQKEAIINYQQKLSAGLIDKGLEEQAKEQLKDIQSMLESVKVRNPYAPQLHIPETIFKPLRTNAHYLAFIETVTFYHQFQRSVSTDRQTGAKYIETTIEDIEIANRLLKEVLLTKSDELTKGCRDFFERLKNHLAKENKITFYSQQIRTAFRMSPNNVKYYLAILSKYHLVKVIGGHPRKQGYEYEIIGLEEYKQLKESMNSLNTVLENLKSSVVGNAG